MTLNYSRLIIKMVFFLFTTKKLAQQHTAPFFGLPIATGKWTRKRHKKEYLLWLNFLRTRFLRFLSTEVINHRDGCPHLCVEGAIHFPLVAMHDPLEIDRQLHSEIPHLRPFSPHLSAERNEYGNKEQTARCWSLTGVDVYQLEDKELTLNQRRWSWL